MIGCKVMRTLASVEFEIILILGLPCCLSSSSSVRCLKDVVEMSQEAIKQACLVETETESEPFEDPVETETLESLHTVASPTSLPDSTPPTCHAEESVDSDTSGARPTSLDFTAPLSPNHLLTHTSPTLVSFLRRTARIAVRVLPAMSPGLSASIAEVAAMSDSAFHKRFKSSYESSPSSLPPDLLSRKLSWGTSKLVEDEEEENEEVEESSDSDSESEDALDEGPAIEDEGPTTRDEGPATGDEGLAAEDEGPGIRVESLGLGEDKVVPEGQQRPAMVVETAMGPGSGSVPEPERPERVSALREPTLTTWIDPKDGRAYLDVPVYPPPTPPVQTLPSPKWLSGSLPISPAPSIVPLPISSPMIPLTVPSPVASPTMAEAEGFLTELGARVEMQGGLIHDHKITEERSAWLDLAEIVASMRRG
ncbi:hypothetical protein Tco_1020217 [Tanacetum coccineum]|uniref:Uncharacterized protein n=1 Tax=Tanacetum coccineum TaxID=301880 RepID=A0ABQ5G1M4_9ASTR